MASKPYIDKRHGIWYCKARLTPGGTQKPVRLGKHDAPFRADRPPKKPPAYILDAHRSVAARERDAAFAPRGADRDLAGFLEAYAAHYAATRKNPKSHAAQARVGRAFLAFAKERGVTTLGAVNKALCRDFLETRLTRVGPATVRVERALLSPAWSRAVDDELVAVNPWKLARAPGKGAEHAPRFWTSAEVAAIADACLTPWHRDLVLVLANTGIRISATLAMRWDWVDWQKSVIAIPSEHDKAGKGYRVGLSGGARAVLQRRHAASRSLYVFPGKNGTPADYSTANEFFRKAVARAGVPHGTPHDLRHTYARHLCQTAPINAVQAALGHSSLQQTSRYTKLSGENSVKYVEGFSIGTGEGD